MSDIAAGVFKKLAYKAESTYGTAAGQSSAQSLRRVTSSLDLAKDTYQSNEIREDQQMSDFRHGVRRVQGAINGELSAATWEDFFAAILRKDFAAVSSIALGATTLAITGTGPDWVLERSAGSWLTDGMKVGDVVRITIGAGLTSTNLNKNLLVGALTALEATVYVVNGEELTPDSATATCTIAFPGKKTFTPTTGHTDKSFSIEHWFSDIEESELFLGCKPTQCSIDLPPSGIATINWEMRGRDFADTAAKRTAVNLDDQYFTSPTAATTTGCMAAVNGLVLLAGVPVAVLTGLQLTIAGNFTGDPVVGANVVPNQFPGRVIVSGQAMAYFNGVVQRDAFVNETETSVIAVFTADNSDAADFVTFVMSRVKFGGASKDDGEKGIVQTMPFQALFNGAGGTGTAHDRTTLTVQDSQA